MQPVKIGVIFLVLSYMPLLSLASAPEEQKL